MNIALLGMGRMGKSISKLAEARNHKIVFTLDKDQHEGNLKEANIALNFSIPDAAVSNIKMALEEKIPVVCGTTGWLDRYNEITDLCIKKNTAFLYASNFSIGVNLFFKINKMVAKIMQKQKDNYKVSIQETHHIHKLDSPSGTALSLAESILEEGYYKAWELNGKSNEKLNIDVHREGEIPGIHSVSYCSEFDEISIKHEAANRQAFALGAIIAAEWIYKKKGVFTMQDVLNIS
jgi:4-hydroxy-tetrahydrodipicolinate reductase